MSVKRVNTAEQPRNPLDARFVVVSVWDGVDRAKSDSFTSGDHPPGLSGHEQQAAMAIRILLTKPVGSRITVTKRQVTATKENGDVFEQNRDLLIERVV